MKIPLIGKYFEGSYIGGFLDTYGRATVVISGIQFMIVVIILYTTSVQPAMALYAPWMSFWLYILIAVLIVLGLLVFSRLMIIPSAYTFTNKQLWENNSPIRAKLEEIEKNQQRIMEKLGVEDK